MRASAALVVLALVGFAPGVAFAAGTFGVGGGKTVQGSIQFSFSAHDTPNGPSGYVVEKFAGLAGNPNVAFTLEGPVTCLTVIGNHATIGIQIKKATGAAEPHIGGGFFLDVEDHGEPSGLTPDLFSNSGFLPAPQHGVCSFFQASVFPVEQGNVVVDSG